MKQLLKFLITPLLLAGSISLFAGEDNKIERDEIRRAGYAKPIKIVYLKPTFENRYNDLRTRKHNSASNQNGAQGRKNKRNSY